MKMNTQHPLVYLAAVGTAIGGRLPWWGRHAARVALHRRLAVLAAREKLLPA